MAILLTDRTRRVKEFREKGMPQVEIAKKLRVTRQRIQQIEAGLGFPKRERSLLPVLNSVCRNCNDYFKTKNHKRKFCSRKCAGFFKRIAKTPAEMKERLEERKAEMRKYASWYYYNVFKKRPDWQDIIKKRNNRQGS